MSNKKIAVIGASIAGCALTIMLQKLGFNVTTFEKNNPHKMKEQGFGIGFPPDLLAKLKQLEIVDESFNSLFIYNREYYKYDKKKNLGTFIVYSTPTRTLILL